MVHRRLELVDPLLLYAAIHHHKSVGKATRLTGINMDVDPSGPARMGSYTPRRTVAGLFDTPEKVLAIIHRRAAEGTNLFHRTYTSREALFCRYVDKFFGSWQGALKHAGYEEKYEAERREFICWHRKKR